MALREKWYVVEVDGMYLFVTQDDSIGRVLAVLGSEEEATEWVVDMFKVAEGPRTDNK